MPKKSKEESIRELKDVLKKAEKEIEGWEQIFEILREKLGTDADNKKINKLKERNEERKSDLNSYREIIKILEAKIL